jgi:hypothetical protein
MTEEEVVGGASAAADVSSEIEDKIICSAPLSPVLAEEEEEDKKVIGAAPKLLMWFFINSCTLPFMDEFQWFLTELSVLPGKSLAISAHLLPSK